MPEDKDEWQVVDGVKVKEAVDLFVEFSEEQKLHPRIVVAAMEYIITKIKDHLQMEVKIISKPERKTIH